MSVIQDMVRGYFRRSIFHKLCVLDQKTNHTKNDKIFRIILESYQIENINDLYRLNKEI